MYVHLTYRDGDEESFFIPNAPQDAQQGRNNAMQANIHLEPSWSEIQQDKIVPAGVSILQLPPQTNGEAGKMDVGTFCTVTLTDPRGGSVTAFLTPEQVLNLCDFFSSAGSVYRDSGTITPLSVKI